MLSTALWGFDGIKEFIVIKTIGCLTALYKQLTYWRFRHCSPVLRCFFLSENYRNVGQPFTHLCRLERISWLRIAIGFIGEVFSIRPWKIFLRVTVGPLYCDVGSLATDPEETASVLQGTSVQNFTVGYGRLPAAFHFEQSSGKLIKIPATLLLIRRTIMKLKLKTTGSSDVYVPSTFLSLHWLTVLPFSLPFPSSFEGVTLPATWSLSFITFIF